MLFVVSKLFWMLAQPSTVIALLLAAGLFLSGTRRFAAAGRRVAWTGFALLLIGGLSPLSNWLILPLEQRFPVPALDAGGPYAAIIVLGGPEEGRIAVARRQLSFNESGERITEGARLAKLYPDARLVFTGGTTDLLLKSEGGAPSVADYWRVMGIPDSRILVEDQSRTTLENATLTRAMLKPEAGQRVLLVTSAYHMPRSVGAFRAAGFDVTPYPCDFRTAGPQDAWRFPDAIPRGLRRLDDATKEWLGLLAYRALGKSSALLPGPGDR
jgi:uncharacterized SAM-binding protein YcdF (DUF218 family)